MPITIATKKNAKAVQLVLSEESASVTVEGVGDGDWVLVSVCGCVCAYVFACPPLFHFPWKM